jgi:hypothetical protein
VPPSAAEGETFEQQVLRELAHVAKRLDTLVGEIGRLKGRNLEQRVREDVAHFLRGVVSGARAIEVEDILAGLGSGSLDEEGVAALERADLIAEGTLRNGPAGDAHVVVEISWRVDRHDVTRAHDRAKTLAGAAGRPCLAVVIADDEPELDVIAAAREVGVAVIDGDGILMSPGSPVES